MCGKSPRVPNVPGFSQEEQFASQSQRDILGQQQGALGQFQNISQAISGLFNPDGSINQDALTQFGQELETRRAQEGGLAQQGFGFLGQGSFFGQPNLGAAGQAEEDLFFRALQGTEPVSQGLQDQRKREFEQFKQAAGQRGIRIVGDSPETASSESTAGIRMLSEFNRRFDLSAENERQNLRQFLGPQTLNRLGVLGQQSGQQFSQAMQLAGFNPLDQRLGAFQSATAGIVPMLGDISSGFAQFAQPFQNQRLAQFGVDTQNAQLRQQQQQQLMGGLGSLVGFGVGAFGGPMLGAAGKNLGSRFFKPQE